MSATGSGPVGFLIKGPNNALTNNVVADSVGTGYWYKLDPTRMHSPFIRHACPLELTISNSCMAKQVLIICKIWHMRQQLGTFNVSRLC